MEVFMKGIFNKMLVAALFMSVVSGVKAGGEAVMNANDVVRLVQALGPKVKEAPGIFDNVSSNVAGLTAPIRAVYSFGKWYYPQFKVNPVYMAIGTALVIYGGIQAYKNTVACYKAAPVKKETATPKAAPVKKETATPKTAPVKKETATPTQSQPVTQPVAPIIVPIAKPVANASATTSAPTAKSFTLEQLRAMKPKI
jgi:hypothetical protein